MKKTKLGQELIASLKESRDHVSGKKKLPGITIEIPDPAPNWGKAQVVKLRKECFQVSQVIFAKILSVNVATVRSWEQGLKTPSGPACRLLELAKFEPELFGRLARAQ